MKKKLMNMVGIKAGGGGGGLIGKTVQVGRFRVLVESQLGEGGFACIYKVREVNTDQPYALKHFRTQGIQEAITEVKREAKCMHLLRGHPHVLGLHAVSFAGPERAETEAFFLLDLCKGSLVDELRARNMDIPDDFLLDVFLCVCGGVSAMHGSNPPIAHRDLKAENVLLGKDGNWVLCDFGSASTQARVYNTASEIGLAEDEIMRTTTPAYRPPEMWDLYMKAKVDTKVDIWALGVLLYLLSFGKLPFPVDGKLAVLNLKYTMPAKRSQGLRELIRSLLVTRPEDRPTIGRVIEQVNALRAGIGMPTRRADVGDARRQPGKPKTAAEAQPAPPAPAPHPAAATRPRERHQAPPAPAPAAPVSRPAPKPPPQRQAPAAPATARAPAAAPAPAPAPAAPVFDAFGPSATPAFANQPTEAAGRPAAAAAMAGASSDPFGSGGGGGGSSSSSSGKDPFSSGGSGNGSGNGGGAADPFAAGPAGSASLSAEQDPFGPAAEATQRQLDAVTAAAAEAATAAAEAAVALQVKEMGLQMRQLREQNKALENRVELLEGLVEDQVDALSKMKSLLLRLAAIDPSAPAPQYTAANAAGSTAPAPEPPLAPPAVDAFGSQQPQQHRRNASEPYPVRLQENTLA